MFGPMPQSRHRGDQVLTAQFGQDQTPPASRGSPCSQGPPATGHCGHLVAFGSPRLSGYAPEAIVMANRRFPVFALDRKGWGAALCGVVQFQR